MNVAILGATGAVGREMMKILAERSFPVEELRLLASPRSAGQKLLWQGRELTVQPAEDSAFEGMDIVLGAAENDIAQRFAPAITAHHGAQIPQEHPQGRLFQPGKE